MWPLEQEQTAMILVSVDFQMKVDSSLAFQVKLCQKNSIAQLH